MRPLLGLVILIGGLLIGVYIIADYLFPDVFCKMLPKTSVEPHPEQQYNSQVLSDICSGAVRSHT